MALINDFRAQLAGGGARPSQFRVTLNIPGESQANNAAKFLVRSAVLPASNITPIEVPFRGRFAKIAGERQFANWTVTVLNDNDFLIRAALENWSHDILSHSTTNGKLAPSSYTCDMIVEQLDRNDLVLREYKFYNCFPQNIQEINLDFGSTAQIEEYQVEFSVDFWETSWNSASRASLIA